MSPKNNERIKAPEKIKNEDISDKSKFEKRCKEINGLAGLEDEEIRERMIEDIIKNVPAFKEMAKIITEKKDAFSIGSLTASFKKSEKHMISQLSSELEGLPVFVKPIYSEPNGRYVYDIIVPATEQLIGDNDKDPDKIAVEQFGIIKEIIPQEYKSRLISIKLEPRSPYPITMMFNRGGFWTVWEVAMDMRDFDEFWSLDMCGTMYQDVQPFIGTDKYEYAMILNEEVYKSEFDTLMATLKENITKKEDLILEDTFTLHVSYGWLVKFGIPGGISKRKDIKDVLSTLARRIPIIGRGIPGAYLGEEKLEYDNVSRIINQPTFRRLPGFVYSDAVKKKSSYKIKGR
jgi:hypothetical protein